MIIENEKSKLLHILSELNKRNEDGVKLFTQKELATHLKVSRKKMNNFVNGEIFDFWLLCRYADLLGKRIDFKII